ncbi:MAG: biopolymer transporter ExbD [Bdellovibrionales bacterium]|nr:biopolymer transporter ExbD [Bdellovibrionales bacterium]
MSLVGGVLGPKTFSQHLVRRGQNKRSRKRVIVASLALTSMVDMFSLLVIFLLQSFSTSPELLVVSKGVTLPNAMTGVEIKDAPVLSLASDGIYLDQKKVGETDEVLKNPNELMERLGVLRDRWLKAHPNEKFPGEVNLQADKAVPSTLVARLMAFLPSQHYSSIQLIVMGGQS